MNDSPSAVEILGAITNLLKDRIAPEISGHNAYALRVAINSLGLVSRELELGRQAEAEAVARLQDILQDSGTLDELNVRLCEKIRSGEFTLDDKAVFRHLKQTTIDQVRIDQPGYSGLKYAKPSD